MSVPSLSIVIPFIDSWEFTSKAIANLVKYTHGDTQLVAIDNGSDISHEEDIQSLIKNSSIKLTYVRNESNTGVLATFRQGMKKADANIVCFMHNDVLIHEPLWDLRVVKSFADDASLGLIGLFGARGVQPNGGREGSMSNMLGQEWGSCDCHEVASLHHGERMEGLSPSVVFDGVGLFFKKEALLNIASKTDAFEDWRAPHHFYDRILSLKVLGLGYHMATIGIKFDHYSGVTANRSDKYVEFSKQWLKKYNYGINDIGIDSTIYNIAEYQWTKEFSSVLPIFVDEDYSIHHGQSPLPRMPFNIGYTSNG